MTEDEPEVPEPVVDIVQAFVDLVFWECVLWEHE